MRLLGVQLTLIPLALSIVLGLPLFAVSHTRQTDGLTYRLLRADKRTVAGVQMVGYVVSVDRFPSRGDLERLVCRVLSEQKPESFWRLAINIYHDLDEYMPTAGLPPLEAKLGDHDLAIYIWNVDLPTAKNRLTVMRNTRGEALNPPQGYDFDHTVACK
jgi:hypothetical protein